MLSPFCFFFSFSLSLTHTRTIRLLLPNPTIVFVMSLLSFFFSLACHSISKWKKFARELNYTSTRARQEPALLPSLSHFLSLRFCFRFATVSSGYKGGLEKDGLIPRTIARVFEEAEKRGEEVHFRVSCLEIYNEQATDLLSGKKDALAIRWHQRKCVRGPLSKCLLVTEKGSRMSTCCHLSLSLSLPFVSEGFSSTVFVSSPAHRRIR